jgi:hypothetical protein
MTENLSMGQQAQAQAAAPDRAPDAFDPLAPGNIAPLVVWLGSAESRGVTGRVFNVAGGHLSVAEGWVEGPVTEQNARWDPAELGEVVPDLVARAAANADMRGRRG